MGWETVIVWVVMTYLSYVMAPKPQDAPAANLEDSDIPMADEGVEIPVVFGTRDISGANVVWYGDIKTTPIKSSGGKK